MRARENGGCQRGDPNKKKESNKSIGLPLYYGVKKT
jgi:hypothetical protein